MSFNDDARLEGGKVSKRARNVGIAAGVGGIGVIAVVLVGHFLGVDLSSLVGGSPSASSSDEQLADCQTDKDANDSVDCRMEGAAESLDTYWRTAAASVGAQYHSPHFSLFSGSTQTGCGSATSSTGPFYCAPDERIYLDTAFYDELRTRYGSTVGPLAQMYVVAHEWGHHIQNLAGTLSKSHDGAAGPASASVRTELQADCFAGAWVANASRVKDASGVPLLKPVTKAQIAEALSAAAAVGDDRNRKSAGQGVNPESWTHGSSASRQKWFESGYDRGATACNTFSVSASQL